MLRDHSYYFYSFVAPCHVNDVCSSLSRLEITIISFLLIGGSRVCERS